MGFKEIDLDLNLEVLELETLPRRVPTVQLLELETTLDNIQLAMDLWRKQAPIEGWSFVYSQIQKIRRDVIERIKELEGESL